MMTTEQAREYFAGKGLTYKDVTEGDIAVLMVILKKHLKEANKKEVTSANMRMSVKIKAKYRTNGTITECYLFLNSHYFTQREAISFNKDGFIGFAGWADSGNVSPLIAGFIEWVDVAFDNQETTLIEKSELERLQQIEREWNEHNALDPYAEPKTE